MSDENTTSQAQTVDPAAWEALKEKLAGFEAADAERAAAEAQKATEQKAADDAAALKRGEHEALLATRTEEVAALQARVDAYNAAETARTEALKARNEARIAELPEHMRGLAPEYDKPDQMSSWLDKAMKQVPQFAQGGGKPRSNVSTDVPTEFHAEAARMGFDLSDKKRREQFATHILPSLKKQTPKGVA